MSELISKEQQLIDDMTDATTRYLEAKYENESALAACKVADDHAKHTYASRQKAWNSLDGALKALGWKH